MGKKKKENNDIYMLVADETEGFQLALRYATNRAIFDSARLAIIYVMDKEDFQHWGGVEERIHEAHRQEATGILLEACEKVHALGGPCPVLYIEEGGRFERVHDVIAADDNIKRLILGSEPDSSSPGPLVDYFTSKGLPKLKAPLTIVPGNLSKEIIDNIY